MSDDSPDSQFADRFIEADQSRRCSPGDTASATCAPLASPRPIRRVVIHSLSVAGTPELSGVELVVRRWQKPVDPGEEPHGAHYLVDRDGTATQMVREDEVAFHAGVREVNRDSIGIEHADVCNDPAPLTTQLYERSAAILRDIARRADFQIDSNTVFGHQVINPNRDDPGAYWDFEYYFSLLRWDGVTQDTRPLRSVGTAAELLDAPVGWAFASRRPIDDSHCATLTDPYGAQFLHADLADGIPADFSPVDFQFDVGEPGLYKVSSWWPKFNDATVASVTSVDISLDSDLESASQSVSVDQRSNAGRWNDVGDAFNVTFVPAKIKATIGPGSDNVGGTGTILADAIRLLRIG